MHVFYKKNFDSKISFDNSKSLGKYQGILQRQMPKM